MLALAVEHIDTLLEDWYPSLGTRFLHTSEGKMLVTRMVPCPRCLTTHNERESKKSWQDFSFFKRDAPAEPPQPQAQALLRVSQVLKKLCVFLSTGPTTATPCVRYVFACAMQTLL